MIREGLRERGVLIAVFMLIDNLFQAQPWPFLRITGSATLAGGLVFALGVHIERKRRSWREVTVDYVGLSLMLTIVGAISIVIMTIQARRAERAERAGQTAERRRRPRGGGGRRARARRGAGRTRTISV
jgi:hypothetical protein